MANRIDELFQTSKERLSIYFTAGYPKLEDTATIIQTLADEGVDLIEIGLPFSDPLADGPTIQATSKQALENGMHTRLLFEQLKSIRETVDIPLIIMGNLNPLMQYGVEEFCQKCAEIGIDGLILPDLPLTNFEREYAAFFEANGLYNINLITPQTSEARIRHIDSVSNGFIYLVSSAATTGATSGFQTEQLAYFKRIQDMGLKNPGVIGFGISTAESYQQANKHASGAIIGSAFVKAISDGDLKSEIRKFVKKIKAPLI